MMVLSNSDYWCEELSGAELVQNLPSPRSATAIPIPTSKAKVTA